VSNNFYGGQFGLRGQLRNGRLFAEVQGKLALGATQDVLDIAGQTTLIRSGQTVQTLPGNLFALSSNIGSYSRIGFAVLPEVNANIGWQPLDHVRLLVGYSFFYLSQVARAGGQIDRSLDPHLVPSSVTFGLPGGPARPAGQVNESDFWVQGLNFGLELIF
jgi:hypothetical protein